MIGAHIECDKCGHWAMWTATISNAKRHARRAGWQVGKTVLCPKCKAAKAQKTSRK